MNRRRNEPLRTQNMQIRKERIFALQLKIKNNNWLLLWTNECVHTSVHSLIWLLCLHKLTLISHWLPYSIKRERDAMIFPLVFYLFFWAMFNLLMRKWRRRITTTRQQWHKGNIIYALDRKKRKGKSTSGASSNR